MQHRAVGHAEGAADVGSGVPDEFEAFLHPGQGGAAAFDVLCGGRPEALVESGRLLLKAVDPLRVGGDDLPEAFGACRVVPGELVHGDGQRAAVGQPDVGGDAGCLVLRHRVGLGPTGSAFRRGGPVGGAAMSDGEGPGVPVDQTERGVVLVGSGFGCLRVGGEPAVLRLRGYLGLEEADGIGGLGARQCPVDEGSRDEEAVGVGADADDEFEAQAIEAGRGVRGRLLLAQDGDSVGELVS